MERLVTPCHHRSAASKMMKYALCHFKSSQDRFIIYYFVNTLYLKIIEKNFEKNFVNWNGTPHET